MQWSHYSEAIFEAYLHGHDNLIIQACPGAGKTTNIKELWKLNDWKCIYLVFNKHNQIEAQEKLPAKQGSAILTLNSLGYRAVRSYNPTVQVDDRKVFKLVTQTLQPHKRLQYKERTKREFVLIKAVQTAKHYSISGSLTEQEYSDMVALYDLEVYDGMFEHCQTVLEWSDEMLSTVDFADQIRLPVIHAMKLPQYDVILGDEVQDFSPLQAKLIQQLQGRYILVGDTHQSIYGFRGAMDNSMEILKECFACREMPLSITYRCSRAVVQEAQRIWPDIEAWNQATEGSVLHGIDNPQYTKDALILCRFNRPLIEMAFTLLRQDIPCHVRGRDIGENLTRLIKQQQAESVSALIDSLSLWYSLEYQKLQARSNDSALDMKLQRLQDRYESALLFANKVRPTDSPQVVINNINTIFEQGKGVCLSTVHKAKGLEADTCYLLEPGLFDWCAGRCKQQWQAVQEKNCKYVAVTRAKNTLVYL